MSPKSSCAVWLYVVLWILCPVVSGQEWKTIGKFQYLIVTQNITFDEAQAACNNSHDAQLVVFANRERYDEFKHLINNTQNKGKEYWLGLRQENPAPTKTDGWYWIDGTLHFHSSDWPIFDVTGIIGEKCARMMYHTSSKKWQWWDSYCSRQKHSYICMKDVPTTTTTNTTTTTTTTTAPSTSTDTTDPSTTTAPVSNVPSTQETPKTTSSEGVDPGATEQEMATTYIGIGAGLGGLVLLLIIVAVIVVAVRRKSTKQQTDSKKQQNSVNHSHSNKAYVDGEDPAYEAEDHSIDPHYQSVDLDSDQVTYTEVETKSRQGAAAATPVDDTYYNTAQVLTSSHSSGRDRDDGVVYSDVETGPRYQNAAAGGGANPKPQQQQSPNAQDNDAAAMYASVEKSAKPKTPTALARNAEASASKDPEAKQPNVPADVDVEEMYAQVNKPPRPDVEPPRPAGNEEEETDYYALAPAVPSKPMELL